MTGEAYEQSARMARVLDRFPVIAMRAAAAFRNRSRKITSTSMLEVIDLHRAP